MFKTYVSAALKGYMHIYNVYETNVAQWSKLFLYVLIGPFILFCIDLNIFRIKRKKDKPKFSKRNIKELILK